MSSRQSAQRRRQLRPIWHLLKRFASWLEQQGIPASQAKDYIARLFLGVTTGALEASERGFQSLAATHATARGINEQFLKYLAEHGVLTRVSEGLDAVLQRISVGS